MTFKSNKPTVTLNLYVCQKTHTPSLTLMCGGSGQSFPASLVASAPNVSPLSWVEKDSKRIDKQRSFSVQTSYFYKYSFLKFYALYHFVELSYKNTIFTHNFKSIRTASDYCGGSPSLFAAGVYRHNTPSLCEGCYAYGSRHFALRLYVTNTRWNKRTATPTTIIKPRSN